jgi:hypothetical protein
MTASGAGDDVLAWVESPFQLLGAVEAHASGLLGRRLRVLPRRGVVPLAATVVEVHRLGLPPGVTVLSPSTAPRHRSGPLAVGDAFSGEVHKLLLLSSPASATLLDDGRSTRRVMDALVRLDVPLIRPHVVPTPARGLLARLALTRLKRLAGQGRLRVVTALQLPSAVTAAAERSGIAIARHDFSWLRGLPGGGIPGHDTVVLGSSLVANDLIAAQPYLDWVRAIAQEGPITYRAHRREDARTLEPLARTPGIVVETGQVPVEVSLRGMSDRQRVITLPTTAVSTLRLITPQARIQEFAVPDTWWLPGVPRAARLHLVPDDGELDPLDRSSHPFSGL